MKTTPDLAQAIVNLRTSSDFEVVLEALARARKDARDDCETIPDGVKLYRAQGRANLIKEFFAICEAAPKDLDLFRNPKP